MTIKNKTLIIILSAIILFAFILISLSPLFINGYSGGVGVADAASVLPSYNHLGGLLTERTTIVPHSNLPLSLRTIDVPSLVFYNSLSLDTDTTFSTTNTPFSSVSSFRSMGSRYAGLTTSSALKPMFFFEDSSVNLISIFDACAEYKLNSNVAYLGYRYDLSTTSSLLLISPQLIMITSNKFTVYSIITFAFTKVSDKYNLSQVIGSNYNEFDKFSSYMPGTSTSYSLFCFSPISKLNTLSYNLVDYTFNQAFIYANSSSRRILDTSSLVFQKYVEKNFSDFGSYLPYFTVPYISPCIQSVGSLVLDVYADNSYDQAFNDGYSVGLTDGIESGKQSGYSNGYNAGYAQASSDASGSYSFFGLISSVIDAPVQVFAKMFDFDVLGTNISKFAFGMALVAVVICIVKIIL